MQVEILNSGKRRCDWSAEEKARIVAETLPAGAKVARVERPEDIGIGIARAIRAAVSGRPGGVYLDLVGEVPGATLDAQAGTSSLVRVVDAAPRQFPAPEASARALDVLETAQRPLIILGKGTAYAQADADIRAFIEQTGIPFLPMSMAKGLLPDDHPQSAAPARRVALAQADVVMLIGARLNWLLGHGRSPQWSATARFCPARHHANGNGQHANGNGQQ
jgi:oxalyl-CoA decarboxylase